MAIELQKLLKRKVTYVSLFTLILLVGLAVWQGFNNFKEEYDVTQRVHGEFPDSLALQAPSQYWVGLSDAFFSSFFYFIFPLLVSLPVVDSLYQERESGNIHYQLIRRNKRDYYGKKFIFTFFAAFFLFLMPLLMGIVLMNFLSGTWDYSSFSAAYDRLVRGTAVVGDSTALTRKKHLFSNLLSISPYLYIMVYYIIGALYAGAYATFGLATSLFMKNRYLILFMPFSLYLGGWFIFSIIQVLNWDPFNFLDPRQPVGRLFYAPFAVDFAVLMVLTVSIYLIGVRRNSDILS